MPAATVLTLPEAIGAGTALILPALMAIWRGASLRGDLYLKWADRVEIARAGLSERAIEHLKLLRSRTDALLGAEESTLFDPAQALVDPGPLARITREFDHTIRARRALQRRFKRTVLVGAVAPFLAIPYIIGCVTSLAYYAGAHGNASYAALGIWLAGVALGVLGILVAFYFYLNWRLTSSEMLSRPGGDES